MKKKFKILVVDDQVYIRKIIILMLEKYGFEVIESSNGKDAISLAKRLRPDVIILDLMMPEINGYEVLKAIKSDLTTNYIKIIIVSAKNQDCDVKKAMDLGADFYMPKPIDVKKLPVEICRLLNIDYTELSDNHNKNIETAIINRIRDAVKNNDKEFIGSKLGMFFDDSQYSSRIKCEAVIAVGSLKIDKYLKEILDTLESEDPMLREKAVWAVGELKELRAYGKICAILKNPAETVDVKMAAALTIKQLGKEDEVKELLDAFKKSLRPPSAGRKKKK